MNQLKKRLEKLEQQNKSSQFAPVLILRPDEVEENPLIGPETVVIIDDIPSKLSRWTVPQLKEMEHWLESGKSYPLPEEIKHLVDYKE